MPFLLRNIRLDLDAPLDDLPGAIARRLRVPRHAIRAYAIVRRSIDARDKDDIHLRFHVELTLDEPPAAQRKRLGRLRPNEAKWIDPIVDVPLDEGSETLKQRPIIIGFGPAGMFAALRLAELGYRPIVLERGRDIRRRHKDILQTFYRERIFSPESNLLFGEGGAGAYSDGKLYTRIRDPLVTTILAKLVEHGADPDILVDARPHIGSDRLPTICGQVRERIESLGGQVRFQARVEDFECQGDRLTSLTVNGERIEGAPVVLAIGHSARDTIRTLARRGVRLDPKPFQIGVRIEHTRETVDRWQYGALAGHVGLGAAEYHVVAKGAAGDLGDLFSFCMCPGGQILPTNESAGLIATNGASKASRTDGFSNSGLVITVDPASLTDRRWLSRRQEVLKRLTPLTETQGEKVPLVDRDPTGSGSAAATIALAGLDYQEFWERLAFAATGESYRVPVQRTADFLDGKASDGSCETSYPLGSMWHDLRAILPSDVTDSLVRGLPMLERGMAGFAGNEGIITAPETRASAPVRITRDPTSRQSVNTSDLYPVGEGAGYAGGIVSAAIDGWRTADAIASRFARP